MKELIKITTNEKGQQLESARELYLGLGLNKTNWSRWYPTNIVRNDFFTKNIDWVGVRHNDEGNTIQDFAISLEFAKHIAMMARTEKSHEYRNYFIECEKAANQLPALSKEIQAIFMLDGKQQKLENEFKDFKESLPLLGVDCDEITKLIKKKCTSVTGYKTPAYKDKSLRGRVYKDIHQQLRREFDISTYKAIKRSQLDLAKEIVSNYKAPIVLQDEIVQANNQINFEEAI